MRRVGRRQLAGRQGIRTLAPQDWGQVFPPEFLSDRRNVRGRRMRSIGKFNYHRGVEWNWLSQFFVQAELKYGEPDMAFRKYLRPQVKAVLERAGIGGISELFDLSGTRGPEFQAWSMSGFLEALHAFAGVRIDVPRRRIVIEPQTPESWQQLSVRKWNGSIPFDVRYTADHQTSAIEAPTKGVPDPLAQVPRREGPRGSSEVRLQIDFPWGQAPDADIEVALVLPARRVADFLDVRLDGTPQVPMWWMEPISGTDRVRVRFTLPAQGRVEVTLGMKRVSARARLTA
jgi:hypothetical protein